MQARISGLCSFRNDVEWKGVSEMKKTFFVVVGALLLAVALIGCGESEKQKPEMDGFNPETNTELVFGNLVLPLPSYYVEQEKENTNFHYYVQGDDGCSFVGGMGNGSKDKYENIGSEGTLDFGETKVAIKNEEQREVAGLPAIVYEGSSKGGMVTTVKCFDETTGNVYLLSLAENNENKKSYLSDFKKVLDGAEYRSTVNPDFKAMMDEYEAFFDEYVAFMEQYLANPGDLSYLNSFASMMAQYEETMQALNSIDQDSLSADDLAYYLETMARINEKLASVAV